MVIILLTLLALVDGYLLAHAYAARNADTVVILVTKYNSGDAPPSSPPVLAHITLRYTGDTAQQIRRAIDTYPYRTPEQLIPLQVCLAPVIGHYYHYQFTFTLAGIIVEVAGADAGGCGWSRSILGIPERAIYAQAGEGNPITAISQITNGAVPAI